MAEYDLDGWKVPDLTDPGELSYHVMRGAGRERTFVPTRVDPQATNLGVEFESPRARHFGKKPRTPATADSTLAAAASVRSSSVFEPMMRISLGSTTSTRCASARKWLRR